MTDRYPGFLFSGAPVSSWEHQYNTFNSGSSRNRLKRTGGYWSSMSDGGGMNMGGMSMGGGMNMAGMNMGGNNTGGAGSSRDTSRTNLIVNYLPQGMSEKDLYEMFGSIGQIESCRVMRDFKTGYCFGFGFVNYVREEDATTAINSFNGYPVQNKRLKVSYARPSGDDIKETNLYVTNLPRGITEAQLDTIFGKYGRIVQKHILRDKNNGNPRGVAFVRYDKREEAQEAISALNNIIPEGGTELLSVKVAEEHGKQKAAYYAGWSAGLHQTREDDYPPFGFGGGPGFAGDGICPPFPQDDPAMMNPIGKIPRGNFGRSQDRSPRPLMFGERPNVSYPGYIMSAKGKGRAGRGMPWSGHGPNYMDERFKGGGNRFRNVPQAYW